MRYPFTLFKFKSKNGLIWHARFWDESLQKYASSRTTGIQVEGKKERRREAEEAAKTILAEITVQKSAPPVVQGTQALPVTHQKKSDAVADIPLIQYLTDFWTPDSEYAKFIGSLTKATLKKWLIWLSGRKTIRRKKGGTVIEGDTITSRRANIVFVEFFPVFNLAVR